MGKLISDITRYGKFIAAREKRKLLKAEAFRLFVDEKISNAEIARRLGKAPWSIAQWLRQAGVFQTNREAGYIRSGIKRGQINPEYAAKKASLAAHNIETRSAIKVWTALDNAWSFRFCAECGKLFLPITKAGNYCGQKCRSKSYVKLNADVLNAKAKKKYEAESQLNQIKAQSDYEAKNPTCKFCCLAISFLKFRTCRRVKFCSKQCGMKSKAAEYISDPIKAAARKIIRQRCYQKRQLNGKNKAEKRIYLRDNIQARIAKNLRTRLYLAVKKSGVTKCGSTFELTGADWPMLSAWLQDKFQSGMNWNNYGKWHVDHKKPCAAFDLTQLEQQRKCFHFTNLQPMWSLENISKGSKILTAV